MTPGEMSPSDLTDSETVKKYRVHDTVDIVLNLLQEEVIEDVLEGQRCTEGFEIMFTR